MSLTTRVYRHLPPRGKDAAASARGAVLRWWRYGGRSLDDRVRDTLRRDAWSEEQWRRHVDEQVGQVLLRAATTVPYYREWWARRRVGGCFESSNDLANWPVLEKDTLRDSPLRLVADDRDPRRCFKDRTSGTSGTPLTIYQSREEVRTWYAIVEARQRRWNGIERDEPWAMVGGQVVVSVDRDEPPYWVHNRALNQLYLSTNHISPHTVPDYAAALREFGPSHMVGYPSSVAVLAEEAMAQGCTLPPLRVFLSNAESLTDRARAVIGEAFDTVVRDTYGMGEAVVGAAECAHGSLHLWPDAGHVEILDDDDQPVADGEVGQLVVTGLVNRTMPLIRYRTGDRGRMVPADAPPCACGRHLPRLASIEGRTTDLLRGEGGRSVFWVNPIFYGMPVRAGQVIQRSVDRIDVLVVPADGWTDEYGDEIAARLRDRVGDLDLRVQVVEAIPRGPNGKFKPVVNEIA